LELESCSLWWCSDSRLLVEMEYRHVARQDNLEIVRVVQGMPFILSEKEV
jgi:hypothetical protein